MSRRPEDANVVLRRAHHRSILIGILVGLGYVALAVRVVPLMLLPDDRLQARAALQYQASVSVEAPRGEILARDGTMLATTVQMPSVHADPSVISPDEAERIAQELAPILGLEPAAVLDRLIRPGRRDVVISPVLDPDLEPQVLAVASRHMVWTRDESTRYYPGRELAVQALGVVGRNGRGLEGLERTLDRNLRGATFRYVQQRDRRGRALTSEVHVRGRSLSGDTVHLTLEPVIQRAAEDALDAIVERSNPLSAMAVVMDVKTGEILAIANRPTTNPNDRYRRDTASLRNHAVADAHEPGSVMKPFIVALAVDEGLVAPDTEVDCEGGAWRVGRNTISDDHPHGVISVTEVLKYSSNIGTAKLAFELGPQKVMDGLIGFGFTQPTGSGFPAEVSGFLRDPAKVRPIELATTAFGQGMTATAVQLASALQALGNDGLRMQPYVVSRIEDRFGQMQFQQRPEKVGRVVSAETARMTIAMMATVFEEGGTGTRAAIPGYTAAGKTGTAQKVVEGRYSPTARVSSFIGVAPATDPRIVIVVMTDTPREGSRYGSTVSGPAFKEIGRRALRHLGVPEDRPAELGKVHRDEPAPAIELAPPELTWAGAGSIRVPDLGGLSMRDVLATVSGSGVRLALLGSGRVVDQVPSAGAVLKPGETLQVTFGTSL